MKTSNRSLLRFLIVNIQLFHCPDGGNGGEGGPGDDENENENLSAKEYVENIKKLKETMVPREDYEKLLADRKELAKAILDAQPGPNAAGDQGGDSPSIDDLRNKLFGKDLDSLSNLDFAKSALELRKKVIESGGYDPFVPQGAKARATPEDYDAAQRVADVLQDCVDKCDGDSGAFTAYLMSRLDDVPMPKKRN